MERSKVERRRDECDELILENMGVVASMVNHVAACYPRHVDRQELWNAGAAGLVEAAHRFRPEQGVSFRRFAGHRVRGAIIDSTRGADWVGKRMRGNLRELRTVEERARGEGRSVDDEELARRLGVGVSVVRARRAVDASATVLYLDQEYGDAESLAGVIAESRSDHLPERALEEREFAGTLRTALRHLPEQQREVVTRHYLNGERLAELAVSFRVTEARVSQICAEAINAIRVYLSTMYDGVPKVATSAPGKRNRLAYVRALESSASWRERLLAADEAPAV